LKNDPITVFRSRTISHAVALRDDIPIRDGDVLLSEDGVAAVGRRAILKHEACR